MAYDFIIYTSRERLPAPQRLRAELLALNPPIELDENLDVANSSGFLAVRHGGAATGFEVTISPVGQREIDAFLRDSLGSQLDTEFLEILQSSDVFMSLSGKTDREIAAALAFARTITHLSAGYLLDPQEGTTLLSPEVP